MQLDEFAGHYDCLTLQAEQGEILGSLSYVPEAAFSGVTFDKVKRQQLSYCYSSKK